MQHIFKRKKVYKLMLHEDLTDKEEMLNQMKMVRFLFYN